ncbi:MAG: LysR family transcriptional regulator [Gemmatimonadales bacterium]|nr:LysR family transcriptional regulator [Gemmatimonadales bacterium]MBA3556367.1 LysR family transcriptional regulator [Gemmatimonadales bacterium]
MGQPARSRPPSAVRKRRPGLQPGTKNWLRLNGVFLMGPRYATLLEGVDRLGSIRAACQEVRLSYRTCLNRIRQMERVLGHPVLETHRGGTEGGGAQLTAEARAVLKVYREWRSELLALSDAAFERALARAPGLAAELEALCMDQPLGGSPRNRRR